MIKLNFFKDYLKLRKIKLSLQKEKKCHIFFELFIFFKSFICKYIKWYFTRKKREKIILKKIVKQYTKTSPSITSDLFQSYVISIINDSIHSGGLADRLRGIISTYAICKKNCLPYKLYFTFPFRLEEYLEPAEYDWKIEQGLICSKADCCDIVVLDTTEDSFYQFNKQKKYLEKKINNINGKQKHVYTNAAFSYSLAYSSLFKELFKPSERLKKSIDEQKKILGQDYLSVSARFLDLLGDFNETFGKGALPKDEAQKLIIESLHQIEKIHSKYPNNKILVNSDSLTFLKAASKLDYTYSIPGTITHIDNKQDSNCYEKYEKTFLDFFMIAYARKIFLLKGSLMHRSGYPFAASKVGGKEFYVIEY